VTLALGVGLGLLGMELLARAVLTDFYRCDPELGWTFVPGKSGLKVDRRLEYVERIHINSAGFHDAEHALEKPPGTFRIVVLGDSMLAGLQVPLEQTLARRLEALLGPGVEVLNCATDGYGTAQAWLAFERRCARYQPDLVLLGFFTFNDVLDNYWVARSLNHPVALRCGRPYFELRDGMLARVGESGAARDGSRVAALLRRSYLYQLLVPPRESAAADGPKLRARHVFLREWSPEQEQAWQVTERLLLALDAEVRARGARLGVLVIPSRFEIQPEWSREQLAEFERMDLGRPRALLTRFLDEAELPHLDLAPGIRAESEAAGEPLYFRNDLHFTERGNQAAAELVAGWVRERCRALGLGAACPS
jgi:lysophospholipase L1-like esterase